MSDYIGTAHAIADEKARIILEAKNLRERIKAFKERLAGISEEDSPHVKMILLSGGHEIEKLPTRFDSLDSKLSGEIGG